MTISLELWLLTILACTQVGFYLRFKRAVREVELLQRDVKLQDSWLRDLQKEVDDLTQKAKS